MKNKTFGWLMVVLVTTTLAFVILGLCVGSTPLTPGQVISGLLRLDPGSVESSILWVVRLPQVMGGALAGCALALSGLLLQLLTRKRGLEAGENRHFAEKIGLALDMIYNRYFDDLTVDEVSAVCGYSKSSFCRVFKAVTGDTFHNTLNRHRVEIAGDMLRATRLPVEKIAEQIGYPDAKSFCRVFKRITGVSAGSYRKNKSVQ